MIFMAEKKDSKLRNQLLHASKVVLAVSCPINIAKQVSFLVVMLSLGFYLEEGVAEPHLSLGDRRYVARHACARAACVAPGYFAWLAWLVGRSAAAPGVNMPS